MKTLLAILLAFFLNSVSANTYYFSSISGDDSRTSTQAQNSSTPWKTLSKLNSFFPSLQPGDSVLLNKGEVFYGYITVSMSGTSLRSIVIASYGTGAKPIISGLTDISDWNSLGNGVWESTNSLLGNAVNILTINGTAQALGRYPNRNTANGGYLTFESHSGSTQITDNELFSLPNWTGGEIVIRKNRWIIDRHPIIQHTGNTINFTSTSSYAPVDKFGYFVQNHISTLDTMGEWCFDPSLKKLKIYFGSNSPASYQVNASCIGTLISIQNKSYIVIDGIKLIGSNLASVTISNAKFIRILNTDIDLSGANGINGTNSANLEVYNSSIANTYNNALLFNSCSYSSLKNNNIRKTGLIPGMGSSGDDSYQAILIRGNNNLVQFNTVDSTGYIPIRFSGDSALIKNNFINYYTIIKDDGGGIYTYKGASNNSPNYGRKVIGNIVLNAIGTIEGTNSNYFQAYGIYVDDNSDNVEIYGNTIANCNGSGIHIRNSKKITIKDNIAFNNLRQLEMVHDSVVPNTPIRNITSKNNIFFSKYTNQICSNLSSLDTDIHQFGIFDSNYYCRPMDDNFVILTAKVNGGINSTSIYDLPHWKSAYSFDSTSKKSPVQFSPYTVNNYININKFENGSFNYNIKGAYSFSTNGNGGISWNNAGALDSGSLKVAYQTPQGGYNHVNVNLNLTPVVAGKNYLIKFSVVGTTNDKMLEVFLRIPYSIISSKKYFPIKTNRSDYELVLSCLSTQNSPSLIFEIDQPNGLVYIDNIKVFEANVSFTNPDDYIRFEYNASNLTKSVPLNGSYIDVKNNKFSNNIVLQPYTSSILIKDGGTVTTPPNETPSVNITSPINNATFASPASITISATAADIDGSVSKVDFYNGSTLLGSDNTSPYTFTWNNVATGNYSLTAKASDNGTLVTTSSAVAISVYTPNVAPTVSITGPINNTTFASPASVTISATAADIDGSVSRVDFYNGSTLLGSDNTSPYTFTWNNVPNGSYSLTAKATDNGTLVTTSSAVAISMYTPNVAPTVNITGPINNTTFASPASVTISATAADIDGSVSKVDFYNGSTLLGSDNTSPYTFTWNNVTTGNYSLTAKATDNGTLVTTSSAVAISMYTPNVAPTVSITGPINNTTFASPASVTISVTAADIDGSVSKVDFYNGSTLLGSDNTSPYIFTWNNVPNGSYSLTAKATDNGTLVTTSSAVAISVYTPNIAPTVSITGPINNTTFASPAFVTISATAADIDGSVSKVDFYNGSTLLGSDNTSPYTFTWNNVTTGNYSLTAKATDNGVLTTASSAVSISLYTPNKAPTVNITSPVNNATFASLSSVTISANAADGADGSISKVDFYNGTTLLGTDNTSPYTFTWNNVATGNYSLTAKATDNGTLVTTSSAVAISVYTPNVAPTVSITGPINNTTFASPASVTISATAADIDGSVSKVDFYNGSTLLGSDNTSPYTFTWNNVTTGNYSLTAKATDNGTLTTASSVVSIWLYTPLNVAPTVSITNPVNNSKYTGPATINMKAMANDSDGKISKVEFYNGITLLKIKYTSPYTYIWNNVPLGNYTLTAKAYDNSGNVTTSDGVLISVVTRKTPTVSITNPVNNAKYTGPATINMKAIASDADGKISKVEFYNGTTLLKIEYTSPYTYTWKNVSAGNYILTAKAYDNSGNITISAGVSISVNNSTPAIGNSILNPKSNSLSNSTFALAPWLHNSGNYLEPVSIKLGPNPASNTISVFITGLQKDKELVISVLSISGVVQKNINTTISNRVVTVDISLLNNGIYFIQVMSGDLVVLKQFVKS